MDIYWPPTDFLTDEGLPPRCTRYQILMNLCCIDTDSDGSYDKCTIGFFFLPLKKLIEENRDDNYVVALPPSGLNDWYYKQIKKTNSIVIALNDKPENVLNRITFYDYDSNLIQKKLTDKEKNIT